MWGKVGEEGQREGRAGPEFRLGVVRVQMVVKWGGRWAFSPILHPIPAAGPPRADPCPLCGLGQATQCF